MFTISEAPTCITTGTLESFVTRLWGSGAEATASSIPPESRTQSIERPLFWANHLQAVSYVPPPWSIRKGWLINGLCYRLFRNKQLIAICPTAESAMQRAERAFP